MCRQNNVRRRFAVVVLIFAASRSVSFAQAAEGFAWEAGEWETTLLYDGRPALRYMHRPYDDSSAGAREETIKPFWHVYSPDGQVLLTKGAGGLYTHHRGLFYGFNKVTYGGGRTCDVWHCTDGAHQAHVAELSSDANEHRASYLALLNWFGADDQPFAIEQRKIVVTRPERHGAVGWQIDFTSHLSAVNGEPIHLDGDPQHAGFHFRAAQEVADDTAQQTYYVRVDGRGAAGETRNWDHKAPDAPMNAECENRPWNAMSVVVGGQRYTIAYLDHPTNPKPSRYSERDYGRFGSYFVTDVADVPLVVRYRIWVQAGEMTPEQCARMSADFNAENTVLPAGPPVPAVVR